MGNCFRYRIPFIYESNFYFNTFYGGMWTFRFGLNVVLGFSNVSNKLSNKPFLQSSYNCRYAPIIWNSLQGPWKGFTRFSHAPWTLFEAAELSICPIIAVYAQKGPCLMTVCPKGTCLLTGCLKGNFKQYALWLDALKGIFSNMPYDWMP